MRDLNFKQFKHPITRVSRSASSGTRSCTAALPIVITQVRELTLEPASTAWGARPSSRHLAVEVTMPAIREPRRREPDVSRPQAQGARSDSPRARRRTDEPDEGSDQAHVEARRGGPAGDRRDHEVRSGGPRRETRRLARHAGAEAVDEFARKIGKAEPWIEVFWQVPLDRPRRGAVRRSRLWRDEHDPESTGRRRLWLELYAVEQSRGADTDQSRRRYAGSSRTSRAASTGRCGSRSRRWRSRAARAL